MAFVVDVGPVTSTIKASNGAEAEALAALVLSMAKTELKFVKTEGRLMPSGKRFFIEVGTGRFRTGLIWTVMMSLMTAKGKWRADFYSPSMQSRNINSRELKDTLDLIFWSNAKLYEDKSRVANLEYRPYLQAACEAFIDRPRGIWHCATNAGKTFMAGALCSYYPDARILITVPHTRSGLAAQGYETFRDELEIPDVALVKGSKLSNARIVWAATSTLASRFKSVKSSKGIKSWLNSFDLVIKDECHEMSETELQIYDHMNCWAKLGMSGTPFVKESIRDLTLIGTWGPTVYRVSNKYLVDNNYSAEPYVYCLELQHPRSPDFGEYSEYLSYISSLQWRNNLLCSIAALLDQRGNRVVITCDRREDHAKPLAGLLNTIGSTLIYSGELTPDQRKMVIKSFVDGQTKFLVGTRVFSTGISVPTISALVLASGSKNLTIQLQRIGRGIRRKDDRNRIVLIDVMDQVKYGKSQGRHRYKVWKADPAFHVRVVKDLGALMAALNKDGN